MKTATDEQLLAELTTDPLSLGYRNADGSWKSASQIGHLLSMNLPEGRYILAGELEEMPAQQPRPRPCRATELWNGGAIELKRIARILHGEKWEEVMAKDGDA